jgi:hypothetical protein
LEGYEAATEGLLLFLTLKEVELEVRERSGGGRERR